MAETYQKWIRQNALQEYISIESGLSDEEVNQAIQHSDVLCLPSIERTEAFGVVLLEAMRAAKACICTDVSGSGMSYVVAHKKTGYVVKHNDTQALYAALSCYSNHREIATIHGKQGRRRFNAHFDMVEIGKLWSSCYENTTL